METHGSDARRLLDAVADTRAGVADRMVPVWWHHPALGVLLGAFVASFALGTLATVLAAVVAGLGYPALLALTRRRTGVGTAGVRTRWSSTLTVLLGGCLAVTLTVAAVAQAAGWSRWLPVLAGTAQAAATWFLGRTHDADLRRELSGGQTAGPAR